MSVKVARSESRRGSAISEYKMLRSQRTLLTFSSVVSIVFAILRLELQFKVGNKLNIGSHQLYSFFVRSPPELRVDWESPQASPGGILYPGPLSPCPSTRLAPRDRPRRVAIRADG